MTEKEARFKKEILISYKALKHSVINFSAGRFYSNVRIAVITKAQRRKTNKQTRKLRSNREAWPYTNSYTHEPHPKKKMAESDNASGTGSSRQKKGKVSQFCNIRQGFRFLLQRHQMDCKILQRQKCHFTQQIFNTYVLDMKLNAGEREVIGFMYQLSAALKLSALKK